MAQHNEPHRASNDQLLTVMDTGRELVHELDNPLRTPNPIKQVDKAQAYFQDAAQVLKTVAEAEARRVVPPAQQKAQAQLVQSLEKAAQGVDQALAALGEMKNDLMVNMKSKVGDIQKLITGDGRQPGGTPSLVSDLAAIRKQGRDMDRAPALEAAVQRKPPALPYVVEMHDGKAFARRDAAQQREGKRFEIDHQQVNQLGLKAGDRVLVVFDESKNLHVQGRLDHGQQAQQQTRGPARH